MKRNKASSSKNSKKRTFKKRYELDREFIKLYNITSLVRGPKYDIAELFQDGDFADQADADEAYDTTEIMPYIFYILSDAEYKTHKNHKIKKIIIKFCDNDNKVFKLPHRAFDLFRNQFWVEIDHADPLSPDIDYYKCELAQLKSRKEEDRVFDIYNEQVPSDNIWNEYCKIEGRITISRDDFSRWLYRLNCLVFDLLDHPYLIEKHWQIRLKLIQRFVQTKYSREYEYFDVDRWAVALKDKKFNQAKAYQNRLEDARKLLNNFFSQVKIESALEDFLKDCYDGFAEELHNKGLLTRCGCCGAFIPFIKNKKYCSLLNEGRDCGKKARNQKYYSTRGKSRLPMYRRKTRALRKYYKEKGIKK